MEALLYQKVFEKAQSIKSANNLGEIATFLARVLDDKDLISNGYKISPRTLKRGFIEYLDPQLLNNFKWSREKDYKKEKYVPNLGTLDLLSIYLGYKNFAGFSADNMDKEMVDEKEKKDKTNSTTIEVYQYGPNNKSVGDISSEGDVNLSF